MKKYLLALLILTARPLMADTGKEEQAVMLAEIPGMFEEIEDLCPRVYANNECGDYIAWYHKAQEELKTLQSGQTKDDKFNYAVQLFTLHRTTTLMLAVAQAEAYKKFR